MRYQQVLLPCEATVRSAHNKVVAEADTVVALWERLERALTYEQLWEVRDTKTGKTLTPSEFQSIINRIKGWC